MATPPQASAAFTVNGSTPTGAVAVAAESTVTLALVSTVGVRSATWHVRGTHSPDATAPTIASGTSTSFTMPAGSGQSYLIECVVNQGVDSEGRRASRLYSRAVVGVVNAAGVVPFAVGEKTERSATHGWVGVLNDAMDAAPPVGIRTVSGTSHTLTADDSSTEIRTTSGSETTITVPPQSSVGWEDDTRIPLLQLGAGQLVVAAGSGVTINKESGFELKIRGQYLPAMLARTAEDEWVLYGALEET